MNFLSMDYFLMLAKERNFTRAAEKLHVTQQTLSAHIAALEKETGSPLFVRHVPLELTYAGTIFLRYAEGFQQNMRSLKNELNDAACNKAGELRIGTAPARERILLPDLITSFQKEHPRVRFQLTEASNQVLQEKLLNGEIDLAIANFPKSLPGIERIPFYEEELILLAAARLLERTAIPEALRNKDALTYKELRTIIGAVPLLTNSKDTIVGSIIWRFFAENDIVPIVKAESGNMETLLRLCSLGNGILLCPEILAHNTLTEEQLTKMKQYHLPQFRFTISFGCRKEKHRWSVLNAFIQNALHEQA